MIEMLHLQTANFSDIRPLDYLERGKLSFHQRLGFLLEDVVAEIFKVLNIDLERHVSFPISKSKMGNYTVHTPDFYDRKKHAIYDVKLNVLLRNSFEMRAMIKNINPKETWIIYLVGTEPKKTKRNMNFINVKQYIPQLIDKGREDLVEVLDSIYKLAKGDFV